MSSRLRRVLIPSAVLLVCCAGVLLRPCFSEAQDAAGKASEERTEFADGEAAENDQEYRLREGAKLEEVTGEFLRGGDRIQFSLEGRKAKLTVLENQAAHRVWDELNEARTPRKWTVSGLVTEYRGNNYLLVSRAVLRAKSSD